MCDIYFAVIYCILWDLQNTLFLHYHKVKADINLPKNKNSTQIYNLNKKSWKDFHIAIFFTNMPPKTRTIMTIQFFFYKNKCKFFYSKQTFTWLLVTSLLVFAPLYCALVYLAVLYCYLPDCYCCTLLQYSVFILLYFTVMCCS